MEEKSRIKFAVLIAVILAAAVVYSFTFNLFGRTPSVSLAGSTGAAPSDSGGQSLDETLVRVEVTPRTVQSVIAQLSRYRSYSRTVQVDYLRGGESLGGMTAQVAVDNGWTRVDLTTAGGVEHTITGDGTCYLWHNGEEDWVTLPAQGGDADLAQRLPTYEDVLALEPDSITDAGYVDRGGMACVYVEVAEEELGYLERYWVSVESGLLVSAETVKGDEVVYSMAAYEVESPLTGGSDRFTLPDGAVLHQVEG